MKKKFQLLFYLLCFFFPFTTLHALDIKVEKSDCTCKNNGKIKVTAINPIGEALYALDYVDDDGTIKHYASGLFTALNYASGLDSRLYMAKVFDKGANTIDTVYIKLENLYVPMTLDLPISDKDYGNVCTENGTLKVNVQGGSKPYTYKITNNTTGETYTQMSNTDYTFPNLSSGFYSVVVTDTCGEVASVINDVEVKSDGIPLDDVEFTSLDVAEGGITFNGSSHCDQLTFILDNSRILINGTNEIPTHHSEALQYVVEYPAGTGTFSTLSPKLGVNGTHHEITIHNFDPDILDYRIGVLHPCGGTPILDTTILKIPKVDIVYTVKEAKYLYDGFCKADSATFSITKRVDGITNYTCGVYPYTVTASSATQTKSMQWASGAYFNFDAFLAMDTAYVLSIVDASGDTLYLDQAYMLPDPERGAGMAIFQKAYANYIEDCDFTTGTIRSFIQQPMGNSLSIFQNLPGSKAVATIISGPTTDRPPIEILITEANEKDTFQLWNDLPHGSYMIEWGYYRDSNDVTSYCRPKEKRVLNLISYAAGFKLEDPVITSPVCNKYNILVKGYYFDEANQPILSDQLRYTYAAYLIPEGSTTPIAKATGYSLNNNYAQFSNVEPGKYIIKVGNAYNQYEDLNCLYGTFGPYTLEATVAPTIDAMKSGGISCYGGPANMTIVVTGGKKPLQYRYKKETDPDTAFSPYQSTNVFTNLPVGTYMVAVLDSCGYETKSELSIFDGSEQFLEILGETSIGSGVVCSNATIELSVLSLGPIVAYQWFKDDVRIEGATTDRYVIKNVTEADLGKYVVKINNGSCIIENSITIDSIGYASDKPIISGDGCGKIPQELVITNHIEDQTYTWYLNGKPISGVSGNTYIATQEGVYTAIVNVKSQGCPSAISDKYYISPSILYWKDSPEDSNWNNPNNWVKEDGSPTLAPPGPCTEAHIGNSDSSNDGPNLDPTVTTSTSYGSPSCDKIIFHYGSRIYTPERLSYNKAIIHYNFGYYNGNYTGSLSNIESTYPAKTINPKTPISRGTWNLVATPLKKMVTGDFSFSGYPMTWQSHIDVQDSDPSLATPNLTEVNFTKPFQTNDFELSNYNNAMALKVAAYQSGVIGQDNHKYLESLNGIMAYPYFEDPDIMAKRPGTGYNPIRQESTMYYFDMKTLEMIYNPVGQIYRGQESYRFIFESDATNKVDTIRTAGSYKGQPGYTMQVTSTSSSYTLIGNPFMTPISFDDLYAVNSSSFETYGYYTFDSSSQTWSFENVGGIIEPLEAVLVKLKSSADKLLFPITLAHKNTDTRLSAESQVGYSNLVVGLKDSKKEYRNKALLSQNFSNVEKIVSVDGTNTPEVYFVAKSGEYNLIQNNTDISEIGIGVKYSNTNNPITLEFANIPESGIEQPVLVDKVLDNTIDLNRNADYTFIQRNQAPEKQYADNTRFILKLLDEDSSISFTDITIKLLGDNLNVISNRGNIVNLRIVDMQGRIVSELKNLGVSTYSEPVYLPLGAYVVRVITDQDVTKSQKIAVLN